MNRIQFRRDTSARWKLFNPILMEGELGLETDTKMRKIGDGVNHWNDIEYTAVENITLELGDSTNAVMSLKAVKDIIGLNDYPKFSTIILYNINDIVNYNGKLYKFINTHLGEWDSLNVTEVSFKNLLDSDILNTNSNIGVDDLFTIDFEENIDNRWTELIKYKEGLVVDRTTVIINSNILESFVLVFWDLNNAYQEIRIHKEEFGIPKIIVVNKSHSLYIRIYGKHSKGHAEIKVVSGKSELIYNNKKEIADKLIPASLENDGLMTSLQVLNLSNTKSIVDNLYTFTDNYELNKAIKCIYVDDSKYTGLEFLDTLCIKYIRKLENNHVISIVNKSNDLPITYIVTKIPQEEYSFETSDNLFIYVKLDWNKINAGQTNFNALFTNAVYDKTNDPRKNLTYCTNPNYKNGINYLYVDTLGNFSNDDKFYLTLKNEDTRIGIRLRCKKESKEYIFNDYIEKNNGYISNIVNRIMNSYVTKGSLIFIYGNINWNTIGSNVLQIGGKQDGWLMTENCFNSNFIPQINLDLVEQHNVKKTLYQNIFNEFTQFSVKKPIITNNTNSLVIKIKDQEDFNGLLNTITNLQSQINSNNSISIIFNKGTFFYSEDSNKNNCLSKAIYTISKFNPTIKINICGYDSKMIAEGVLYSIDSPLAEIIGNTYKLPYSYEHKYDSSDGVHHYYPYNGFINLDTYENLENSYNFDTITEYEILDLSKHLCKAEISNSLYSEKSLNECTDMYVLTEMYHYSMNLSKVFKISKENDKLYMYFIPSNELESLYEKNGNIQKGIKRYKILNYDDVEHVYVKNGYIYIPVKYLNVYESRTESFININNYDVNPNIKFNNGEYTDGKINLINIANIQYGSNVVNNSLELSGLNFISNKSFVSEGYYWLNYYFLNSNHWRRGTININDIHTSIYIHNCTFNLQRSFIINIRKSDNVLVTSNIFKDNYTNCVTTNETCSKTDISKNIFINNGKNYQTSYLVESFGTDFNIHNNIFKDFSYVAIRSGLYTDARYNPDTWDISYGIIEYNDISLSDDFYKNRYQNVLDDIGAIYIPGYNKRVVVRYNLIYNTTSSDDWSSVGIYLDTSCKNLTVFSNLILSNVNVSITTGFLDRYSDYSEFNRINLSRFNYYMYNIVTSKIILKGNPNYPEDCFNYTNILLYNKEKPNLEILNTKQESLVYIKYRDIHKSEIYLPSKKLWYNLQQFGIDDFIFKHFHYDK